MKCRPLRVNDQMQCHCGLAWDIDEEKPECSGVDLAKGKNETAVAKSLTIQEMMALEEKDNDYYNNQFDPRHDV